MFKNTSKISISKIAVIIIFISLIMTSFNIKRWKQCTIIQHDVYIYYSYLPATFIYKDLSFKYIDTIPKDDNYEFRYVQCASGGRIQKMTMGMAFVYAPFFLIAHYFSELVGLQTDGYTQLYQFALAMGALIYSLLGLILLRKILLCFFNEFATTLTLISIYAGTNLLYYITNESAMAHCYNFTLFTVVIYYTLKWYKKQEIKYAAIIGFSSGLITLIRPTNIIILLVPLLFGVVNFKGIIDNLKLFYKHKYQILLAAGLFILIIAPQLIFWKMASGQWFYYSYSNEKLEFANPHIIEGLFGFRKGLFIYTPIIALAFIGIFFMLNRKSKLSKFTILLISFNVINIYIVLSWWNWWYGGSFGQRAFIESFALLAIPMADLYQWFSAKKIVLKLSLIIIVLAFVFLNCFQIIQYSRNIIHWDSMTKEAYKAVFLKLKKPANLDNLLKEPKAD
ncbi:MAG: hypothetical protein KA792_07700 [Bacteroidales bacterium]|nr:hypothetical protein [Bacteroidales bacterium]